MIAKTALARLYPEQAQQYQLAVRYSGKFSDYNANVRMRGNHIMFSLSKSWKGVHEEILIGLMQSLLVKLFKKKQTTTSMDLYYNFIKSLAHIAPRTEVHPLLESSFERVNSVYFDSLLDTPNLVMGTFSTRKLGSYEFQSDTITISKAVIHDRDLLDYVMYHEMLHKHFKFKCGPGRTLYHSRQFKAAEAKFKDARLLEHRLKQLHLQSKRRKSALFSFFR